MSFQSPQLDKYKQQAVEDFKKNVSYLREKTQVAQSQYVEPATDYISQNAQARPFATALLAVFLATSFFPILSFILFALASILTIGGGALVFGLFWIAVLIGGAATALVGTLFFAAIFSIFIVFWSSVAFLSYRFVLTVGTAPKISDGFQAFEKEVKGRLGLSPLIDLSSTKTTKVAPGGYHSVNGDQSGEEQDVKITNLTS